MNVYGTVVKRLPPACFGKNVNDRYSLLPMRITGAAGFFAGHSIPVPDSHNIEIIKEE